MNIIGSRCPQAAKSKSRQRPHSIHSVFFIGTSFKEKPHLTAFPFFPLYHGAAKAANRKVLNRPLFRFIENILFLIEKIPVINIHHPKDISFGIHGVNAAFGIHP